MVERILVKMAKKLVISILPDIPMPRRRLLHLGGIETGFLAFSGPPRHSNAPPRRTSRPRRSLGIPVSFVFVALFR